MASTLQKQLPDRVLEQSRLGKIRLSVASYQPRSKRKKFRVELEAIGQFNKINSDSWWILYRIGASHNGALLDTIEPPKPDSERTLLTLLYANSAAAEAAFNQMVLWLSEGH